MADRLVAVKLKVVVFAAAVMELLLKVAARLASVFRAKFSVIPAGKPLNVSRMLVPFATGEKPLFELCKAVRKAEGKPSVRIKDPLAFVIVPLALTDAVPKLVCPGRAPMAKLPIAGPRLLITVAVVLAKK